MDKPFMVSGTVLLTSTITSQTVTFANTGYNDSIVIYNGGANMLFAQPGASIAAPGVTASGGTGTGYAAWAIAPGSTQVFAYEEQAGTVAYIAQTAGGTVTMSVGSGY